MSNSFYKMKMGIVKTLEMLATITFIFTNKEITSTMIEVLNHQIKSIESTIQSVQSFTKEDTPVNRKYAKDYAKDFDNILPVLIKHLPVQDLQTGDKETLAGTPNIEYRSRKLMTVGFFLEKIPLLERFSFMTSFYRTVVEPWFPHMGLGYHVGATNYECQCLFGALFSTPLNDQLREWMEIAYLMGYNDGDGCWAFYANTNKAPSIRIAIAGISGLNHFQGWLTKRFENAQCDVPFFNSFDTLIDNLQFMKGNGNTVSMSFREVSQRHKVENKKLLDVMANMSILKKDEAKLVSDAFPNQLMFNGVGKGKTSPETMTIRTNLASALSNAKDKDNRIRTQSVSSYLCRLITMGETYGLEVGLGWLAGFFGSDGTLEVQPRGMSLGVIFCQSNPDLLQAIQIFLEVYFGIDGGHLLSYRDLDKCSTLKYSKRDSVRKLALTVGLYDIQRRMSWMIILILSASPTYLNKKDTSKCYRAVVFVQYVVGKLIIDILKWFESS